MDFRIPDTIAATDKGKSGPTIALNEVSGTGLKLRQRLFGELPGQVSGGQGATEMRRLARPQRREVSRSRAFRLSAQRRQSGSGPATRDDGRACSRTSFAERPRADEAPGHRGTAQ